ncbi:hypothetical protein [Jeotgalibaca porci]
MDYEAMWHTLKNVLHINMDEEPCEEKAQHSYSEILKLMDFIEEREVTNE